MKRFVSILMLSIGMILSSQSGGFAQSADEPARFDVRKIGLIDMSFVLRNAAATTKVRELLDGKKEEFSAEFQQREAELLQTERELNLKRGVLSQEEFSAEVQAFQNEVAEVQKEIQFKRNSLDQAFQQAQDNLRTLASEIVTSIATSEKLDMVLTKDAALIFRQDLNITQDVLEILNERTKNARIEVGELPF